jgi:rhamnosyltransferase
MVHRIAAVVILFHPQESVVENIQSYLPHAEKLFIFDNSPSASKHVLDRIGRADKIHYLTENKNVGIGVALNSAARNAIEEGYDYLLTMDQDSAAAEDMIALMVSVENKYSSVGMVVPLHHVENDSTSAPAHEEECVLTTMTSGNLVNLAAYKNIGGYDEKLFIDYVDHDYCLRLQLNGFSVVRANKAILYHRVGSLAERKFLWWNVHPTNHHPARLYYQTRNRFYLRRLYGNKFPEYFRNDNKAFWKNIVKIVLFEEHRVRKLAMICRGGIALWRNDFTSHPIL